MSSNRTAIGHGPGSEYQYSLIPVPKLNSLLVFVAGRMGENAHDDGNGVVFGVLVKSGSVDYETGELRLELARSLMDGESIVAVYES